MKLLLKSTVLAAIMMVANVQAAPKMQQCSPMEVLHSGSAGLSYELRCTAGSWDMRYTGSMPAGLTAVEAQFLLEAQSPEGGNFKQKRKVALPSAAHLGQALLREVVLLDSGDIALRDCDTPNCSRYSSLGDTNELAKATVTVAPEVQRLQAEHSKLSAQLASTQSKLIASASQNEANTKLIEDLQSQLAIAQKNLEAKLADHQATVDALNGPSPVEIDLRAKLADGDAVKLEYAKKLEAEQLRVKAMEAELEALKAAQVDSKKEVESLELKKSELLALQAKEQDLTAKIAQLTTQLADKDAMIAKAVAAEGVASEKAVSASRLADQSKASAASLEVTSRDVTQKLRDVTKERDELLAKVAQLQESVTSRDVTVTARDAELQGKIAELEQKLATSGELEAKLSAEAEAAHARIKELEAQIATTQHLSAQESEQAQAVATMVEARDAIAATLTAVLDENKKLTQDYEALADLALAQYESLQGVSKLYTEAAEYTVGVIAEYQELEAKKLAVEKELEDVRQLLELANAKVQVANMARDLSMQAAQVAHIDADGMNLQLQSLGQQVAQKNSELAALTTKLETLAQENAALKLLATAAAVEASVVVSEPSSAPVQAAAQCAPTKGCVEPATLEKTAKPIMAGAAIPAGQQDAEAQLAEVLPELYALRFKLEKANAKISELEAENTDLRAKLDAKTAELAGLESKHAAQVAELERTHQGALAATEAKLQAALAAKEQAQHASQEAQDKLAQAQAIQEVAARDIAKAKAQPATAEPPKIIKKYRPMVMNFTKTSVKK